MRCLEIEQPTEQGTYIGTLVPSVVVLAEGETWVGQGAKEISGAGPARGLRRNEHFFFECKNDIGTQRRYAKAPEGFRSPAEIGQQLVSFLLTAAARTGHERTVVTVPASFQVAQRQSTMEAVRLAGLEVMDGDLFDEPLAAFVDHLFSHGDNLDIAAGATRRLAVFDFGGGTESRRKSASGSSWSSPTGCTILADASGRRTSCEPCFGRRIDRMPDC